jgi:hypothetical protein
MVNDPQYSWPLQTGNITEKPGFRPYWCLIAEELTVLDNPPLRLRAVKKPPAILAFQESDPDAFAHAHSRRSARRRAGGARRRSRRLCA